MKISVVKIAAIFSLVALSFGMALAEPVAASPTTFVRGRIAIVSPANNVVTVLTEPENRPVNFYGLDKTQIQRSKSQIGIPADLRPGLSVAVYYTVQRDHFYSVRILLPDPNLAVPAVPLTSAESKALDSKAANDGDITTNPGAKARIDRDLTTQPGTKDPTDPDITKQAK